MNEMTEDWDNCCPLCMEEMDSTDRQLKACPCGYQICLWCWNHIMEMGEKDSTEGRCPACRTPYDKQRIVSMTVNSERSADVSEKKQKSGKAKTKASEGRKNLSNIRVIQRNLVYVIGIPANLADEETLERKEYFGQYGKILKISVSKPTAHNSSGATSVSVYVMYVNEEDAFRCIQAVNGYTLEGKILKACFGTTKYCNAWLKYMPCNNLDYLYLHDEGRPEDSFTKEEMIAKYGSKNQQFHDLTHPSQRRSGVTLPPPIDVSSIMSTSGVHAIPGSAAKPSMPFPNLLKADSLPAVASWGSRSSSQKTAQDRIGGCSAFSRARPGLEVSTAATTLASLAAVTVTCMDKHSVQITDITSVNHQNVESQEGFHTSDTGFASATSPASTLNVFLSTSHVGHKQSTSNSQPATPADGFEGSLGLAFSQMADFHNGHDSDGGSINFDISNRGWEYPKMDEWPLSTTKCKFADTFQRNTGKSILQEGSQDKYDASSASIQLYKINKVTSGSEHMLGDASVSIVSDVSLSHGQRNLVEESGIHNSTSEAWPHVSDSQVLSHMQDVSCAHGKTVSTSGNFCSSASLECSVGALSIHLNAGLHSNALGTSGGREVMQNDIPAVDFGLAMLSAFTNEPMQKTTDSEPSVKLREELEEKSLQADFRFENRESNGILAHDREQSKVGDEHKIISDMFSEGFDIWTDGSPQDWAQFLFNRKHSDASSASVPIDAPSFWKSSNSRQSRFHFARQVEAGEDAPLEHRILISHRKLTEAVNTTCGNISEQLPVGSSSFAFCLHGDDKDTKKNAASFTPSDPLAASTGPILHSLSTPPGFLTTRTSAVPPGFSLSKPLDARKTLGQDSGSFLSAMSVDNPVDASNSTIDMEFIDPAIMAVGRGKFPADSMSQSVSVPVTPLPGVYGESLSAPLSQRSRSQDFNASCQMHPRRGFGGMNSNSQFERTNQVIGGSSSSFLFQSSCNRDIISPSRFICQYQDGMGLCAPLQDSVYNNSIFKSKHQQSSINAWDKWNRNPSNSEANVFWQRLPSDPVGCMGMSQLALDRLLQARLEEVAGSEGRGPKCYGDMVTNDHDDQGAFSTSRLGH